VSLSFQPKAIGQSGVEPPHSKAPSHRTPKIAGETGRVRIKKAQRYIAGQKRYSHARRSTGVACSRLSAVYRSRGPCPIFRQTFDTGATVKRRAPTGGSSALLSANKPTRGRLAYGVPKDSLVRTRPCLFYSKIYHRSQPLAILQPQEFSQKSQIHGTPENDAENRSRPDADIKPFKGTSYEPKWCEPRDLLPTQFAPVIVQIRTGKTVTR
jgi:hypothetical protein